MDGTAFHTSVPVGRVLVIVVTIAGLGSLVVLGMAVGAFARRRSWSYLLVAGAIGALLARSIVGGLFVTGWLGTDLHHVLEHGLDVTVAALVIAAVYYARTVERRVSSEEP